MRDALLVRRWTAAAQWLLIAAAAWAGALAVNAAVAFWLDSTPKLTFRDAQRANRQRNGRASAAARGYAVIFERNLFGTEPIAVTTGGESSGPIESSAELRLLGTAQVDSLGYAVIEDVAGEREDVFAVGENVFDGPTLIAVGEGSAVLNMDGRKVTLEISAPEPKSAAHEPRRRAGGGGGDGIRQTGSQSYLVDRREIEHSVENLSQIATQLRAVPFLKDGDAIGFRVFNIRNGSIFERMGLHNGDVIQKVNGVELDSPSKALALLEDVQTAEEIRVDLLRENAPSTLVYTVR